jgi:hypothetical protein
MLRRRKRKNSTGNETHPEPPPLVPNSATPSPFSVDVHRETKTSPVLSDAFKGAIEKVADWSRNGFASEGKIRPMVFFVHVDGTMKAVSLSFKGELHKELLKTRIREKAVAENAFTVIILTEMDNEGHKVVLSGVSPGMKACAQVDYRFDNESKTITSWKINWMNQAVQNIFLDGIFDVTS